MCSCFLPHSGQVSAQFLCQFAEISIGIPMIKTLTTASIILATLSLTPAEAARRHFWWMEDAPAYLVDDGYYGDTSDEQDYFVQDQFNQEQYDLYIKRKHLKKKPRYDQAYYEPRIEQPTYKPKVFKKKIVAKPVAPKPVVKPVKVSSTVTPINKRYDMSVATKSISCTKGAGIVSGYGFTSITNKSCAGTTFVYGATRSGKNFDIEVSAATGELTAVKKL
jgi:hypothetical protein